MINSHTPRIALVAGELSGDILGAGLIRELKKYLPQARFEGIGGPRMLAQGLHSHYPLDALSVMGLFEVLKHYPRLKRMHTQLKKHFVAEKIDILIGIDAPDFNLPLETYVKQAGIPTVHYVSPSVWAWREYRLKKIARACDMMLTLLPFEAEYYEKHHIPVRFVGHPLAAEIPLQTDKKVARQALGLAPEATYIALLPGSRNAEVRQLTRIFLQTASQLASHPRKPQYLIPLAGKHVAPYIREQAAQFPDLPLHLFDGNAAGVLQAADAVLLASGTASLETMLYKRPMVVAYRLSPLTFQLAKRLVHIPYFSLPNLLAGREVVKEFIQDQVTPQNLVPALAGCLDNTAQHAGNMLLFKQLHETLRVGADERAAQAVMSLLA